MTKPAEVTVSFHTMGCRLNQSESDTLDSSFSVNGYRVVSPEDFSDISVINTCSVTESAEAKCRYLIRKIMRRSPTTFIAVTGCYAQLGVNALRKIPGVDLIAGSDHKMLLPSLVQNAVGKKLAKLSEPLVFHSPKISKENFTLPTISTAETMRDAVSGVVIPLMAGASVFNHQTRPNIKIQDGCDFFCSFCIIPFTRGRDRSRTWDNILLEASLWAAQGHKEIVLTGVNLGEYSCEGNVPSGGNVARERGLADLVNALEAIEGLYRIRISSIEPTTVSPRLFDSMKDGKLCSHLHLPLQSGSNAVLSNMGRRYTREDYIGFVSDAIDKIPHLALGTDVMVGFPGEGEEEFEETVSLIEALPFSYLHVFPFSERKGTRVTRMGLKKNTPYQIKKRSKVLLDISKKKREAFYRAAVGQSFDVLFERRSDVCDSHDEGLFYGFSDNYIRIRVKSPRNLSGQLRPVLITGVENSSQGTLPHAVGVLL